MDKISEILNSIKERVSNPLIFSFLVSWLVYNWEITVALVWYDKSQIVSEGCKSIFEFIQYKLDTKCCNTIFPVIAAIIYTLGFPYLKYLISILNSKALEWGKKNEIKYIKEVTSNDILNLNNQIKDIQKNLNESNIIISNIRNNSLINGYWKLIYERHLQTSTGSETTKREEHQIFISGKDYYIVENDIRKKKCSIKEFYFDNKDVLMIMSIDKSYLSDKYEDGDLTLISKLSIENNNWNYISGFENNVKVEYIKI